MAEEDAAGLFPEPEHAVPPGPVKPAQRLRDRQAAAVRMGQHPLTVALKIPIPLHAHAVRDLDGPADSPRCGNCVLRRLTRTGDRPFPKCTAHPVSRSNTIRGRTFRWEEHPRATKGVGTDVRIGWPACTDYQPEED